MCDYYIKVGEYEHESETIELPVEQNGTIFLSSVCAQFPGACGLKYRNPQSQSVRGLKLVDGDIYLPTQDINWQDLLYIVVYPKDNKRKMEDEDSNSTRSKRPAQKCSDLIVLGLPWKLTEEDLEKYFSAFGELCVTLIKRDSTGKSKGYGFIRYTNYEVQEQVTKKRHMIDGRWCEVKIPHSKEEPGMSPKIFVGRVSETMSKDDLQTYFEKYGEVDDVYIPSPFRAFAFVTFRDAAVAQSLIGEDHVIKGVSVYINTANPKSAKDGNNRFNGNSAASGMQMNYSFPVGAGSSGGGRNDGYGAAQAYAGAAGLQQYPPATQAADMSQNGGGAGFGMMNPAVLAAALGSWNTMLNGMLGSDPGKTQTGGRGDTGGNWRNPSDGNNWNIKQ